jgi:Flp pilus assembly protein TadG
MQLSMRGIFGRGRRALRPFRRFARKDDGVTAVEFALVAAPFFGLMLAILETSIIFFSQETLETAVANAAREIRTGQAQQQGFSASDFKSEICKQVLALFNCSAGLSLDVRTYPNFAAINLVTPKTTGGALDTSNFTYNPGHGTDIVVVRAFYEWPLMSSLIGADLSNMADGGHMLAAAAAFRNEPFPW